MPGFCLFKQILWRGQDVKLRVQKLMNLLSNSDDLGLSFIPLSLTIDDEVK